MSNCSFCSPFALPIVNSQAHFYLLSSSRIICILFIIIYIIIKYIYIISIIIYILLLYKLFLLLKLYTFLLLISIFILLNTPSCFICCFNFWSFIILLSEVASNVFNCDVIAWGVLYLYVDNPI